MAFWSEAITTDPRRQHRWIVSISGISGLSGQIAYIAKKVTKPKVTVNTAEHKFLNHTFYFPGNVTYDPVTLTLTDPINPNSSAALYTLLQESGYVKPSAIDSSVGPGDMAATVSKRLGTAAMGDVKIKQLDGDGNIQDIMVLHNPWVESVDFGGELSYEADALVDITMTIRYDWFSMQFSQAPSK